MLTLKMKHESGKDVLSVMNGRDWILSLPARLNMGTPPAESELPSILSGESLYMGVCGPTSVFRIENKDGAGMYNCGDDSSIDNCPLYDHVKDKKFHPAPWQDSKLARQMYAQYMIDPDPVRIQLMGTPLTEESESWRYGFASKEQARMWLHDDRIINWLSEHGFIVAEFSVSFTDALLGNTQVMFRNAPEHYKKHDIKKFFNI